MNRKIACVLMFAAVAASTAPAEDKTVSAVEPVAAEALTLSVGFDGNCEADIAAGRGTPSEIRGKVQYQNGISGKALEVGKNGGCVLFRLPGQFGF